MYECEHRKNINNRLTNCGYQKTSISMNKETFIKFGKENNIKLHVYYRHRNKTCYSSMYFSKYPLDIQL